MKIMTLKIFLSFFLLFVSENRAENISKNEAVNLNNFYQSLYLGERRIGDYTGALDTQTFFDSDLGELKFLDEEFKNQYLNTEIEKDFFGNSDFWFKKIVEKSGCPDSTLSENSDYIRYLFRLLTMSYLFESIKSSHQIANQLGANKSICSLSYDDLFSKCGPKTNDMKKFQERIYGKFVNEISKIRIEYFGKNEIDSWQEGFKHSTSLTNNLIYSRLYDWCYNDKKEKKDCRKLTLSEIKMALGEICSRDRDLIHNICSEKDEIYGLSYVEKALELIQDSNAFNVVNKNGMGENCLRRFVKMFTPKEVRHEVLGRQFPLIYSQLIKEKSRYKQGELFLPGALKEFDMKGLSDFLAALKPPKKEEGIKLKPVRKLKVKPKIIEIKSAPILATVLPVLQDEAPVPVVKISEFEKTLIALNESSLASVYLNMEKFRDDFEFSAEMIADLANPIKKFQTRAALSDMKSYDNLGSKEAPVGLIFIKYLLDTENHQGLYNILAILKNKFYVLNDLEKKSVPVYIELKNDESTKNQWQIILLKAAEK